MCLVGIRVIVENLFSFFSYMHRLEKGDRPHFFGSLFSKSRLLQTIVKENIEVETNKH
jgi:hypothetical protein